MWEEKPANKPLISGGSDRAPPIRLQNEITWTERNYLAKHKQGVIRNKNSLLASDGGLHNGNVVKEHDLPDCLVALLSALNSEFGKT